MANVGVFKLGNISLDKTALFVCDMQEKFQPAIAHFADILDVTKRLVSNMIRACRILSLMKQKLYGN